MLTIVDYGMGNLRSAQKGFEHAGVSDVCIASDPATIAAAEALVLPGVGAFGDAMKHLRAAGIDEVLRDRVAAGTPLLGICLGMQLLLDESLEFGIHAGLGLVPGTVRPLPQVPGCKVPHMGWNTPEHRDPELFAGIPNEAAFYFVHSYYCDCADSSTVAATVPYGAQLPCALRRGSLYAVQFHPEKSSRWGLVLLANFARIARARIAAARGEEA